MLQEVEVEQHIMDQLQVLEDPVVEDQLVQVQSEHLELHILVEVEAVEYMMVVVDMLEEQVGVV